MNKNVKKLIKELKKICNEYNFWSQESMRWTLSRIKSKLDEVDLMISEVTNKFEKIDILVNNAGIIHDGLLLRMSDDAWAKVIDTNLNGTFYCSRAAIKLMFKSKWGRIINIGSVVGLRGNVGQTNYSASKAAINGFTFALAKEVATRNITVNTITPGYINTDTVEVLSDKQKEAIMSWIPMQKFGDVEDISNMVGYLASMLTKGKNAPGKSVFQFMVLLTGIFSIKVANRYKIAISYRRIELVFDRSHAPLTAVKSKL